MTNTITIPPAPHVVSAAEVVDKFYSMQRHLLPQNPILLDAGCGEGRHTRYFATRGFRVVGIDDNLNTLRLAAEATPDEAIKSGNIRYNLGNIAQASFTETYFDGVLCNETLQMVPTSQRESVIRKLISVTRSGGFHIVSAYVGPVSTPSKLKPVAYNYLANLYSRFDWDIISSVQEPYKGQVLNGAEIISSIASIVAVKP